MKYEDYNDPLYLIWNKDTSGNLVSVKVTNEVYNVRYGIFVLKGVPDEGYKVLIDNMTEVKDKEELGKDEFEVDYVYGIVRMNPSINDKEITIKEYWSRGNYYYPSHRIYWTIDEFTGKVTTLNDFLEYILNYFNDTKKYVDEALTEIRYYKETIHQIIEDFRIELQHKTEEIMKKIQDEFEKLGIKIDESKEERRKLQDTIDEAIIAGVDLNELLYGIDKFNFIGHGKPTKIDIKNFKFPLEIKSEGIELGKERRGFTVDGIFRYCIFMVKFYAHGKVKNPIFYDYQKGNYFKVNVELEDGDLLSVVTSFYHNKAKIYKGGNEAKNVEVINVSDKIECNEPFMYLQVGKSVFFYDAEENEQNLTAELLFDGRNLDSYALEDDSKIVTENVSILSSNIDKNGVYTKVEYKNRYGILLMTTELQNRNVLGNYEICKATFYDEDGTERKIIKYELIYDKNNKFIEQKILHSEEYIHQNKKFTWGELKDKVTYGDLRDFLWSEISKKKVKNNERN